MPEQLQIDVQFMDQKSSIVSDRVSSYYPSFVKESAIVNSAVICQLLKRYFLA